MSGTTNITEEQYLAQLEAMSFDFLERIKNDEVAKSYVSFDLMSSVFSASESGVPWEKVRGALPVASWREDTVQVPRAWVRTIVDGWMDYRQAKTGRTLGECYGMEGGGQGKGRMVAKQKTKANQKRLSNLAVIELLHAQSEGTPISQDAAFSIVAEAHGVSRHSVEAAYKRYSHATLAKLCATPKG